MIACEPKDNKLVAPNRTVSPGQQSTGSNNQGLRVGSYGLPILATQKIEKMSALVQFCLESVQSGDIQAVGVQDLLRFNCKIAQHQEHTQTGVTQIMNEEWSLQVDFSKDALTFDVTNLVSVRGQLNEGLNLGRFKNEVLKTTFGTDQFLINQENGILNFKINQIFEVTATSGSYFMTNNTTGKIQLDASTWKTSFQTNYRYVNQSRIYQVSAENLELSWKTRTCADFNGETTVLDGKAHATIRLQSDMARLVTTDRPWQQGLVPCANRDFSFQNFDFIFY